MADIASSDLTITILKNRLVKGSPGALQRNLVRIAFGNATLTYPSGGVPIPTFPSFGMRREIEYLVIVDGSCATGIHWKWDYTNKKFRGYIPGAVIEAAGAATLDDYPLDGTADPLAAAARQPGNGVVSLGLGNTTAAGVVYFGNLKELLATEHAPAAQSLVCEAVGW
jgi:hypothetical protein